MDIARALRWMDEGQRLLEEQIASADLSGPSLLPGWTRAHVAGHVAASADALGNLLTWARTGVETPMYASDEARNADIERRAATLTPERLHGEAVEAGKRLGATIAEMPDESWDAKVRHRSGAVFSGRDLPWLRVREVWIHSVDMNTGVGFDRFPADLVDALLSDVSRDLPKREGCPAVVLAPSDRDRTWEIAGAGAAVTADAPAAGLLAWTIGRAPAPGASLPALPAWL
ncbi:maleylpyruvate isomerase family mycothiol-dependent enzyme [Spongiactinospora sp. TRM90649]|uniref:maleylpyruvate isomerase family mycothiol-dependent enzyme n=1 Tax=Spongiactinospora sp. TRM90649 TaxID=3031114 RepID=UPI0023FA313D|nr:maleylpyruvate isomerase family mycothiol-dependent enzyme [Spongiactinospora sp. TRM90649]MDF5753209.1 maleylpyruvate isomerase family mycothiol-dependent enzyme [Spongiactinospora sp. TRM90649]